MKKIIKFTCVMFIASVVSFSVEAKKMPMAKKEVTSQKKVRLAKVVFKNTKKSKMVADCWEDACGHILGCCFGSFEALTNPVPVCKN